MTQGILNTDYQMYGIFSTGDANDVILRQVYNTYKVRRVICLDRNVYKNVQERVNRNKLQMQVLDYHMDPGNSGQASAMMSNVLSLISGNSPVLITCVQGQDRTGFLIAAYLIKSGKMSPCQAVAKVESTHNYGNGISELQKTNYNTVLGCSNKEKSTDASEEDVSKLENELSDLLGTNVDIGSVDDIVDQMRDNFGQTQGGLTDGARDGGYWGDNIGFGNNWVDVDAEKYPGPIGARARNIFLKRIIKVADKYRVSFAGTNDGSWDSIPGYLLNYQKEDYDWLMSPSLSSKNDWKTFHVDGATESNTGFRKALKDIVDKNPELNDFLITFDGSYIKISELINSVIESDFSKIKFYHGTSEKAWELIKFSGLMPRSKSGFDPAYGTASSAAEGNPDLVYLTTQIQMASFASRDAARAHNSQSIILEIIGLDENLAEPDEDSGEDTAIDSLNKIGSIGYRGIISPNKIKPIISRTSGKKLINRIISVSKNTDDIHDAFLGGGPSGSPTGEAPSATSESPSIPGYIADVEKRKKRRERLLKILEQIEDEEELPENIKLVDVGATPTQMGPGIANTFNTPSGAPGAPNAAGPSEPSGLVQL